MKNDITFEETKFHYPAILGNVKVTSKKLEIDTMTFPTLSDYTVHKYHDEITYNDIKNRRAFDKECNFGFDMSYQIDRADEEEYSIGENGHIMMKGRVNFLDQSSTVNQNTGNKMIVPFQRKDHMFPFGIDVMEIAEGLKFKEFIDKDNDEINSNPKLRFTVSKQQDDNDSFYTIRMGWMAVTSTTHVTSTTWADVESELVLHVPVTEFENGEKGLEFGFYMRPLMFRYDINKIYTLNNCAIRAKGAIMQYPTQDRNMDPKKLVGARLFHSLILKDRNVFNITNILIDKEPELSDQYYIEDFVNESLFYTMFDEEWFFINGYHTLLFDIDNESYQKVAFLITPEFISGEEEVQNDKQASNME